MTASAFAPPHPELSTAARLLAWYDRHARALPWRVPPGAPRPEDGAFAYRVWLSEVMLQQTGVAAVRPRFERFVTRWPDVDALAAAPEAEIMAEWAGLGYYARARNMIACARIVAARGGFPHTEGELRQLPGLGAYAAAAIAAIAFGERAVVVDANVERVVARLFAIGTPLPAARPAIRAATDRITPANRAGDFAQAMMDLGATICTPRAPRCLPCPLREECHAYASGTPEAFPVIPPKADKPLRQGCAFAALREGAVWLVTRPAGSMFGGMRALPDDGWTARSDGSGQPPLEAKWTLRGTVRHSFTHARLDLAVLSAEVDRPPPGAGEWWPLDRLAEAGLPTMYARAAALALAPVAPNAPD